jgi:hypothetical protein
MCATVKEGSRFGTDGIARDAMILRRAWNLDRDKIVAPMEIRQGREDPLIGFPRALVKTNASPSLVEFDGGHTAALGKTVLRGVVEDMHRQADGAAFMRDTLVTNRLR